MAVVPEIVPVPSVVAPSLKVTVPVMAGVAEGNIAVKVRGCAVTDGLRVDVTVRLARTPLLTTCTIGVAEVTEFQLLSPP